jgi:hypothetical protein
MTDAVWRGTRPAQRAERPNGRRAQWRAPSWRAAPEGLQR